MCYAGPLAGTHAHEVMSICGQLLARYDDSAGRTADASGQRDGASHQRDVSSRPTEHCARHNANASQHEDGNTREDEQSGQVTPTAIHDKPAVPEDQAPQ